MSGIADTAAAAQEAIDAGNHAFKAIAVAEAEIIKAQGVVRAILGEMESSGALADWIMLLNQTHSNLIIARNTVPVANEFGNRFLVNLFS